MRHRGRRSRQPLNSTAPVQVPSAPVATPRLAVSGGHSSDRCAQRADASRSAGSTRRDRRACPNVRPQCRRARSSTRLSRAHSLSNRASRSKATIHVRASNNIPMAIGSPPTPMGIKDKTTRSTTSPPRRVALRMASNTRTPTPGRIVTPRHARRRRPVPTERCSKACFAPQSLHRR